MMIADHIHRTRWITRQFAQSSCQDLVCVGHHRHAHRGGRLVGDATPTQNVLSEYQRLLVATTSCQPAARKRSGRHDAIKWSGHIAAMIIVVHFKDVLSRGARRDRHQPFDELVEVHRRHNSAPAPVAVR
jgi:hypothetical protein